MQIFSLLQTKFCSGNELWRDKGEDKAWNLLEYIMALSWPGSAGKEQVSDSEFPDFVKPVPDVIWWKRSTHGILATCFCLPSQQFFSGLYLLMNLSLGLLGPVVRNPPCRGRGFDPWSGKTPHAAEQLDPWATPLTPCAASTEAQALGTRALRQESPGQWAACAPEL